MNEQHRLTPEGAALLRAARDQIVAHPEQFDMAHWDCGTTACIAGWMARMNPALLTHDIIDDCDSLHSRQPSTRKISALCGFAADQGGVCGGTNHPLAPLFYDHCESTDAIAAAARINAFLWQYGYPPDEITVPSAVKGRLRGVGALGRT